MAKTSTLAARIGPNVAKIASLLGDATRARMLFALLDGRECSASELASRSGSSPQAASAHLSKLVEGGLLVARSAGRQRLFVLASQQVANAIEALASIAPVAPVVSLDQQLAMRRLREARSCYDHLAGRVGVTVTQAMLDRRALTSRRGEFALTRAGERLLWDLDIDVVSLKSVRRGLVRPCMDWTERRPHVAGSVGAALLERFLDRRWLERNPADRALRVTAAGRTEFSRLFAVRFEPV